jgi:cyclic beta-1,2-glucan synthetase
LWAQRISGDIPILLLRIDAAEDIAIARQLLQAHEYWRMKGLAADLVILNERAASYVQDLQNALETLVRMSQSRPQPGTHSVRGSVFVLRADLISEQTRTLLSAVARKAGCWRGDSLFKGRDCQRCLPAAPNLAKERRSAGDRTRAADLSLQWPEASARKAANM